MCLQIVTMVWEFFWYRYMADTIVAQMFLRIIPIYRCVWYQSKKITDGWFVCGARWQYANVEVDSVFR